MPIRSYAVISDICDATTEVVVNAANGKGWMGGWIGKHWRLRGVAESLHFFTGGQIEQLAKKQARRLKPKPGDVFSTHPIMRFRSVVFHAVTMAKPGQRSKLEWVDACLGRIMEMCHEEGYKSITIPLLGCGTGKLSDSDVLQLIFKHFDKSDLEVVIAHPKYPTGGVYIGTGTIPVFFNPMIPSQSNHSPSIKHDEPELGFHFYQDEVTGKWLLPQEICQLGGCDTEILSFASEDDARKMAINLTKQGKRVKVGFPCDNCYNEYKEMNEV